MAVVIHIKCPDGSLIEAPLFGSVVTLGRSSKTDIKIDDPLMSGRHCSVELKKTKFILEILVRPMVPTSTIVKYSILV